MAKVNELNANVYAYDPLCTPEEAKKFGAEFTDSFTNMDCILILTDHKEFYDLNWEKIGKEMRSKVLVDGRHIVDPTPVRKPGFIHKEIRRK